MNLQFVKQTSREVLLHGAGTAADRDVLAAGRFSCLFECGLDAVGNKIKCRAALHGQGISRVMCEHEHWMIKRRIVAPPAVPGIATPRSANRAEHVSAHDRGANVVECFPQHVIVDAGFTAPLFTVQRAESFCGNGPIVEMFTAFTERIAFARTTYMFNTADSPSAFVADFRDYYGPTINAFAAAAQNGKSADLQRELETLFVQLNTSADGGTLIPATFLKVTVTV